ncbi:NAD-dependent succinate-semialdehyde dehydrogenase [Nocardia xishanensis]|uniref:NAD-dependent succinate-semialdehyde dehydrogenase n=1 Tax=Nocardia xishanensis TaxID=238964 RepID=UPI0033EEB474
MTLTHHTTESELPVDAPTQLFVAGRWAPATTEKTIAVENPATGQVLARVADASPEDGARALDAAAAAQQSWAATTPRVRANLLRAAFDKVIERRDDFARLITLEMGKPLADAHAEVTYGAEFLRWFAEEAVRIHGRYANSPDGNSRLMVHEQPVGPCMFVTPWNFPLAMATRKIGPALAAGCTVVIKPAALTPLTTLLLADVLHQVGVPDGVVNVVPTSSAGALVAPLLSDPRLRKISFTGSTPVGRALLRDSADQVLRASMELGGNAPFLIFADADLDAALAGAMIAKMRNTGQACTAANRFLVHASIADEFTGALTRAMAALRTGPGIEPATQVGPLVDGKSLAAVHGLVEDACAQGARIRTGGTRLDGPGHFYPPTVLDQVPAHADILREEIFGPVAPIVTFTTEEQAVALANDTPYGLAAYAYTRDLARAQRLTEQIESGMLGINTGLVSNPAAPFGGIKQSGLGREGGSEGIKEYLESRYVAFADPTTATPAR